MSRLFSLDEAIVKARARVDALPMALDRLSVEAEDLSERRIGFTSDGEALLARVAHLEEADVAARSQLQGEYHVLAGRLEEHVHHLIDAGSSFRSSMIRASTFADSGSAIGRSSLLSIRAEAVGQSLRRMQEGPAWNNIRSKA
jgi:hypothetical protein